MTCQRRERASNLEMYRGNSLVFEVFVLKADGTQQDITGWSMWATIKRYISDPDSAAVAQLGNILPFTGITLTQPLLGVAEVELPPQATRLFPDSPVTVVYDVKVKDPILGRVFTVEVGRIVVRPTVTQVGST